MSTASITANVDIANLALSRLGEPAISTLTEVSRDATACNQLFAQNRDYCLMLADWDCLLQRSTLTRAGKTAISGITAANPPHVTATGHLFIANELVSVESVTGMSQINDNLYRVFAIGTNSLTLYNTDGTSLDASGYTAWTSGGYVYRSSGNWAFAYDLPTDCIRVAAIMNEIGKLQPKYSWTKERNFIYTDIENAGVKYVKQTTDPTLFEADLVEVMSARLSWLVSMRIHSDKALRTQVYNEMNQAIQRARMTNSQGEGDDGAPEDLWVDAQR